MDIEATINKPELLVCKDLKTFADEWNSTIKPNISKKIADLDLKSQFNDVQNSLNNAVRTVEREISNLPNRRSYTNPNESLERAIETAQVTLFVSFSLSHLLNIPDRTR